jgi:hypothetical protein
MITELENIEKHTCHFLDKEESIYQDGINEGIDDMCLSRVLTSSYI